jgi:hypothetical protein
MAYDVLYITSGGNRCKEDAIYVFHLQQCSSHHLPDLSIYIYLSCIKNPHTFLSRPAFASLILHVVTQRALAVFHTSFPPYWGLSYIPFRVMHQAFFFRTFRISSLVLSYWSRLAMHTTYSSVTFKPTPTVPLQLPPIGRSACFQTPAASHSLVYKLDFDSIQLE